MIEQTATVRVQEGLHTRPAAHFARLAKTFEAEVQLVTQRAAANAKSSVKVMLLGVKEGDEVVLRADGPDERIAVAELADYLLDPRAGLNEQHDAASAAAQASPAAASADAASSNVRRGVGGSAGLTVGPVHRYRPAAMRPTRKQIGESEVDAELHRFRRALDAFVDATLHGPASNAQDRAILRAVVDVAQDDEYLGAIVRGIEARGDAVAVTMRVGEALAASFEALADGYLRARAEDVRGVTRTLVASLLGEPLPDLSHIDRPSILVADELSAIELARAPVERLLGLVCKAGSATSHVAIMARQRQIPAVLGVSLDDEALSGATRLAVDGERGEVVIDPTPEQQARFGPLPTPSVDARFPELAADLHDVADVAMALAAGAKRVGVFRTEALFAGSPVLPTEDEQAAVYAELARVFSPQPVAIRTWVATFDGEPEENPLLGCRGVRVGLARPEIFKLQLRALLRAASQGRVRALIPMVSGVDELRSVKLLVDACREELRAEGRPFGDIALGAMVETPAAVLDAEALAREAALLSIDTDALTQYVMATDRANPALASLCRPGHPAVVRAVELTCAAARRAGVRVTLCGDAAASAELLDIFAQIGVDELAVRPRELAAVAARAPAP